MDKIDFINKLNNEFYWCIQLAAYPDRNTGKSNLDDVVETMHHLKWEWSDPYNANNNFIPTKEDIIRKLIDHKDNIIREVKIFDFNNNDEFNTTVSGGGLTVIVRANNSDNFNNIDVHILFSVLDVDNSIPF